MQTESIPVGTQTPESPARSGSSLDRFRAGIWRGLLLALALSAVLFYVGSTTGYLVVTLGEFPALVELWHWMHDNLRSSLLPFVLVLLWFVHSLQRLGSELGAASPTYARVYQLDRRCDVLVGLFFGIGVIWTAIGMRSALIGALGDLDAQSAARLGAFGVLQALVEQGILLALSTTIVGGIGGYLMRIVKLLSVGGVLDRFYSGLNTRQSEAVLERLDAIEIAVRELNAAVPGTADRPRSTTGGPEA